MKRVYLTAMILALSIPPALAGDGADVPGLGDQMYKLLVKLWELVAG